MSPYTGFPLDQPQNVQRANDMEPDQESSLLLLTPAVAGQVMEAFGNFSEALDCLIDLRPEEQLKEEKETPPSSPDEEPETAGDRLRRQATQWMGTTTTLVGKGKAGKDGMTKSVSKSTKQKTTGRSGPVEKITPAGKPKAKRMPSDAIPAKPVEPIIINSDDDDDMAAAISPQDATAETELTGVLGTLTVKEEAAAVDDTTKTTTTAGDVAQASLGLAAQPATISQDETVDQRLSAPSMEYDTGVPADTASTTTPIVVVTPQDERPLLDEAAFTSALNAFATHSPHHLPVPLPRISTLMKRRIHLMMSRMRCRVRGTGRSTSIRRGRR